MGEFCWLTAVAFIIATPLAGYGMERWLENFTYRIHISVWMFVISGMGAFVTGILTIGVRTIRTALTNPVKSLRSE